LNPRRPLDDSAQGKALATRAIGVWSGARLALGLLPEARPRVALLIALGAATSVLDTVVIGLVILLLQFAFGAVQPVEGYGALGLVANFAYGVSTLDIWAIGAITFGILLAHSTLGASYEGLTSHVRLQAYQSFRERVFANWIESDLQADAKRGPGAMVNTIQNETWEAADAVFQYCTLAIAGAITAVYILVLAATSLMLTGIAAALGLISVVLVGVVRSRLFERSQVSIEQKEGLARHLVGNLNALRTLKAFRAERAAVEKSNHLSSALRRTFEQIVLLETAIKPLGDVVNAAVLGTILVVAWSLEYPGTIILGFVIVLFRAQPRAQVVYQTLGRLARSQPSVLTVSRHMTPPPRRDSEGSEDFGGLEHEIRFSAVHYAYSGSDVPVLENLDVVLTRGEMTAVLGPSGAGKSTLINLLLRFAEPQRGAITCDGVPIARFSRSSWLRRVAVAGQDVELIDGTVRENLLIANPGAGEDEAWRALEIAGVADVVHGLPRGLDAEVGSRGVHLSGGQRQRICLARALLVDADILILDEATNAVDLATEQAIYERIRAERPQLTLLVVAHRSAIGRMADRIVVLEEGRIVEDGPPEELLGRPVGTVAALVGATEPTPGVASALASAGARRR
jgi:ABC-type multidrug transport system fused ATPase/permease subunit